MKYNKVNEQLIKKLKEICDPAHIIIDPEALENYAHDETPLYRCKPEVVVKPQNTEQISKIMQLANHNRIPVTPRSGGTSLSGGAVPVYKGIVISLEEMNKIIEIDKKNMLAVVQPGIITEQLGIELGKYNLFFPPDPVSLDSCMIGGNIAENAGGPRAMKYGVTKNYVLGMEVVLANGTIMRLGGKLLKNVTGYDLVDLIIGSEGTLAIITEATLKLLPSPKTVIDLLIPFPSIPDAVNFTIEVLQHELQIAAIEYMDGDVYRMVGEYIQHSLPHIQENAHLIIELHGDEIRLLRKHYEKIGDIALKHNALDVFVGESLRDKEKIWEPRKKASEVLKERTKPVAREDLVVPKDKIPDLIFQLKKAVKKYNAALYAFGHLGDGNIHADLGIDKAREMNSSMIDKMRREIYKITLSLGGTITAEHGIGLSKIAYLTMALNKEQLDIMKRIKQIFDPNNILNPGKIFKEIPG